MKSFSFLDRIGTPTGPGRRGFWMFMACFFAAAVGFELASYRYGHGNPRQLASTSAFLLMSGFQLATQRWLRVLFGITSMPLLVAALIMLVLQK